MTNTALLRAITIDDKRYFPTDNRISFYNFSNIWMWRHYVDYRITEIDGIPCVSGRSDSNGHFVMLPRVDEDEQLRSVLCELRRLLDEPLTLLPLDPAMQARIARLFPDAVIEDHRSTHDYIYLREDLTELGGKKYHSKRNHINAFLEIYPDYRYVRADQTNLDLLRSVAETLYRKDDRLPDEYIAIQELLDNFSELGLCAGMLFAGDEPIAYSIGEKMCDDTALIHIEKADRDFRGAYAMINKLFSSDFADCTYINREEDMGIEGLRKAKLSYHPVMMGEYAAATI